MSRFLFTLRLLLRRPRCALQGHRQHEIVKYPRGRVIVGRGCRCAKVGSVREYGGRFPQPRAN